MEPSPPLPVDLADIFPKVQQEMLAHFALGNLLRHPTPVGAAAEHQWLEFLNRYLPRRYAASSAFVISADGGCSRQIDIAIYDRLYSPMLFPHPAGLYIPAESVYAVFEVKQLLSPEMLRDASEKAASVRALRRTSVPVVSAGSIRPAIPPRDILAGLLAVRSTWDRRFLKNVTRTLEHSPPDRRLDFGCVLLQGAFEFLPAAAGEPHSIHFSPSHEALLFFFIRLVERLRTLGTAPAADLMAYARSLRSFDPYHTRAERPPTRPRN